MGPRDALPRESLFRLGIRLGHVVVAGHEVRELLADSFAHRARGRGQIGHDRARDTCARREVGPSVDEPYGSTASAAICGREGRPAASSRCARCVRRPSSSRSAMTRRERRRRDTPRHPRRRARRPPRAASRTSAGRPAPCRRTRGRIEKVVRRVRHDPRRRAGRGHGRADHAQRATGTLRVGLARLQDADALGRARVGGVRADPETHQSMRSWRTITWSRAGPHADDRDAGTAHLLERQHVVLSGLRQVFERAGRRDVFAPAGKFSRIGFA